MGIIINYALQVCDVSYNQCSKRYCSSSKTEVTKKCVTSFIESVSYCSKLNDSIHNIFIFNDKSSNEVSLFLIRIKEKYSSDTLNIQINNINSNGIMDSIRTCWNCLSSQQGDLIFQVQDDYLFTKDAIYQMVCMFYQLYNELHEEPIINPFNDSFVWKHGCYKYKITPRMIVAGESQYWIQCYDISCSFMTSRSQFNRHWDYYEKFLNMNPLGDEQNNLENITLNRILVNRNVLGLMPLESVGLHMQSECEKDLYIDWKKRWDLIPEI